nr:hypothetical protein [Nocardia xishanensis]
MLAAGLRLAGVRPLVLERRPEHRDIPKANGLGGQILQLLRRPELDEIARDWRIASTSRPPKRMTARPTPCSSGRTPTSPGPQRSTNPPTPPRAPCAKPSRAGSAHPREATAPV